MQLTKQGLATIYTGGGAEYDGNLELLQTKQKQAQKKKRGVWSQGNNMVSPAEFKRQQKSLKHGAVPNWENGKVASLRPQYGELSYSLVVTLSVEILL